jgi:hypothetical protein
MYHNRHCQDLKNARPPRNAAQKSPACPALFGQPSAKYAQHHKRHQEKQQRDRLRFHPGQNVPPELEHLSGAAHRIQGQEGLEDGVIDRLRHIPDRQQGHNHDGQDPADRSFEQQTQKAAEKSGRNGEKQRIAETSVKQNTEAREFHHTLHEKQRRREEKQIKIRRGPFLPQARGVQITAHGLITFRRYNTVTRNLQNIIPQPQAAV